MLHFKKTAYHIIRCGDFGLTGTTVNYFLVGVWIIPPTQLAKSVFTLFTPTLLFSSLSDAFDFNGWNHDRSSSPTVSFVYIICTHVFCIPTNCKFAQLTYTLLSFCSCFYIYLLIYSTVQISLQSNINYTQKTSSVL